MGWLPRMLASGPTRANTISILVTSTIVSGANHNYGLAPVISASVLVILFGSDV